MAKDLFGFLSEPLNAVERDLLYGGSIKEAEKTIQRTIFDTLAQGLQRVVESNWNSATADDLSLMNNKLREWVSFTWLPEQSPFVRKRMSDILSIEIIRSGHNSVILRYPESVNKLYIGEQEEGFAADFYRSISRDALTRELINVYNGNRKVELLAKFKSGGELTREEILYKAAHAIVKLAYSSVSSKEESDFVDILQTLSMDLSK